MAISLQRVIRSTSCLVLRYGFQGCQIEWRYFQFDQIQDGSRLYLGKLQWHCAVTLRQCGFLVTNCLLCVMCVGYDSIVADGCDSCAACDVYGAFILVQHHVL